MKEPRICEPYCPATEKVLGAPVLREVDSSTPELFRDTSGYILSEKVVILDVPPDEREIVAQSIRDMGHFAAVFGDGVVTEKGLEALDVSNCKEAGL